MTEPTRTSSRGSAGGAVGRLVGFIGRHRVATAIAGVLGAGLLAFVLFWFQPQKLFLDTTVSEALPSAGPTAPATESPAGPGPSPGGTPEAPSPAAPSPEPGPVTLAEGAFRSLEHATTGRALIVELPDGSRVLRFEDLDTSNGPDLRVYLSELPPNLGWHDYDERFVDLAALKGNLGDQNYVIPDDVDLSKIQSTVVWCRRFSVGFGVAPLAAP